MKAITLTQPWASLVALGAKKYETRSWQTNYRGPIAIHAAKGFPQWAQELVIKEPFSHVLDNIPLPTGVVLATCRLVRCVSTFSLISSLSEQEMAFGDFTPGRYAWELVDVVLLPEPVAAKGHLGLWEWR